MPGRKYTASSSSYRYGFNGKENDNEVKGEGNQQDYGMRIYDGRLGRFLSVDPLYRDYPFNSSYAFTENSPVANIDLDGLEKEDATTKSFILPPIPSLSPLTKEGTKKIAEKAVAEAVEGGGKAVLKSSIKTIGGTLLKGLGAAAGTILYVLMPLDAGNGSTLPEGYIQNLIKNQPSPQPAPTPTDPRTIAPPRKDNEDGAHLYKTLDNQKNTGVGGLGIVANDMDDPIPYVGITTSKLIGGNSRYSSLSIRGANSEIIATDKLTTIQGAESAIIALNTYGSNYKNHLGNLKNSDVKSNTRVANLAFTHKNRAKILAGITLLNRTRPGWDSATGENSLLFPENKKGVNNPKQ